MNFFWNTVYLCVSEVCWFNKRLNCWLYVVYNCAALFARALSACNIKDLINNVGSAAGAPAAAAGAAAPPAEEAKKEEKKEEEKKEETDSEDEDMGFGKCVLC